MNFPDRPYPANFPFAPEKPQRQVVQPAEKPAVLTPLSAWRFLNKRTFGSISRATF